MPDNLDPRITVMPDGSYFYSGSLLVAGDLYENVAKQARVETDLIKGPCYTRGERGDYKHFPASRVLRDRADRVGKGNHARVDVVSEHSRFDVLCNPYDSSNIYGKVYLHRKTDVTLLDCCSRLLQNWPANWQPDGRGPVPVYCNRHPHHNGNVYKYGGGGVVQGSHPRNHHRGYALLLTKYDTKRSNIFDDGHKDTDFALIPISHGTMNKAEARRIRVHRHFAENDYRAEYGDSYENWYLGATSPANNVSNWFRTVCEIIVGIKSNGIYPDFELEYEYDVPFAWNISVSSTAPSIGRHAR